MKSSNTQYWCGIGIDIVYIPSFSKQLHQPGTQFQTNFTPLEVSECSTSADCDATYAGKWAAKEAFVKAWSSVTMPQAQPLKRHQLKMCEIEILKDTSSRPYIRLNHRIIQYFNSTLQLVNSDDNYAETMKISISHDNDYAIAICHITKN